MSRRRLAGPVGAALVVAVGILMGSGVAAGAGPSTGRSPMGASVRAAAEGSSIRITAFAVNPIDSAEVTVRALRRGRLGAVLFRERLANDRGAYSVHIAHLPSAFRLILSGAKVNGEPLSGELMADFRHFRPSQEVAVINPVTTLVSLLREKHPRLTLAKAQARVRRFLELPTGADLGIALREVSGFDSPYFSMVTFMSEADAHGNLGKFEASLVKAMTRSEKATHRFAPGRRLKGVGTFIARNLAAGVLSYAGGQGAGWILSALGLSSTTGITETDITNLQQGLNALQTSVANLSQQLDNLDAEIKRSAHETQYAALTSQALVIAGTITTVEDNLTQYANQCLKLDAAGRFVPLDSDCVNQKETVTAQLRDPVVNAAYDQLANLVLDTSVNPRGMVHLFGLGLAESRRFFRPADSTAIAQISEYWTNELIQAANLKTELMHVNGVQNSPAPNSLTRFLGDPNASPATLGTFQTNSDAQARLVYPAVPDGTVILTTSPPTMWATSLPSFVPGPAPRNTNKSCPTLPFSTYYGSTPADPTGLNFGAVTISRKNIPLNAPVSYQGFGNWTSPTTNDDGRHADFKTLLTGWTGANPNAWLTAQTKTDPAESPASPGFFDIVGCSFPNWVPIDAQGYRYMQFPDVGSTTGDALDLSTGQVFTKSAAWWVLLVRTLGSGEQYYPYG